MKPHKVQQGEDLLTIAHKYRVCKWEDIYNHPANDRLREFRQDPMSLFPGDIVYIPELLPMSYKLATDQSHTLKIDVPKVNLVLVLAGELGEPYKNVKYELKAGSAVIEGNTDGNGRLEQKIDISVTTAHLKVWPDPEDPEKVEEYELAVGALDPADEIHGVQARLQNLGYNPGGVDGDYGYISEAALLEFQKDYGLELTGVLDAQTIDKINSLYK